MGRVFHTSSRVLVWLGPAHKADDAAFSAIAACPRVPSNNRNGDDAHLAAIKANLDTESKSSSYQLLSSCLYSFGLLLQRLWFSRLWVIKDVTLGRAIRLFCGTRSVTWKNFLACLFQLHALRIATLADDIYVRNLDRG